MADEATKSVQQMKSTGRHYVYIDITDTKLHGSMAHEKLHGVFFLGRQFSLTAWLASAIANEGMCDESGRRGSGKLSTSLR